MHTYDNLENMYDNHWEKQRHFPFAIAIVKENEDEPHLVTMGSRPDNLYRSASYPHVSITIDEAREFLKQSGYRVTKRRETRCITS